MKRINLSWKSAKPSTNGISPSILIDHRRAKDKSKSLLFRMTSHYSFAITSISVFELWKGDNSGEDAFWLKLFSNMTLLDFDVESAKIAGRDFLELQRKGQMIDIEDILIGATAKRNQLRMASTNTKHYSKITGLQLVDMAGI